jgi:phosphonate transport system substrate-binding protein
MELLACPQVNGVTTYHSLIIVPRSSPAVSLLDLKNGRFASADLMSNSGWLFPAMWLRSQEIEAAEFFEDHFISGSHDRSVRAVASGLVDGAAVDHIVYEQMAREDPDLAEATKIIMKSPPFGIPPFVCHPGLDRDLRGELQDILLKMNRDSEGSVILSDLGIDRFVIPVSELYDGVRESVVEWEAW